MSDYTFEEKKHIHRISGIRVPSPTFILSKLGFVDYSRCPAETLKINQAFGTAGHHACHLADNHTLNWDKLSPSLKPYLDAWLKFKKEREVTIAHSELGLCSPKYMFAGIPDKIAQIRGRKRKSIVEIKFAFEINKATRLQTAGYNVLTDENGIKIDTRVTVLLKPDGTYKLEENNDSYDKELFLALLKTLYTRQIILGENIFK